MAYSNLWSVRVKTWWKRSGRWKTPDLMSQPFNPSGNNCKNRKERAWECSNMQRKSMLNMRKSWQIKKEENNKFSYSIKDLITKVFSNNNKWEILSDSCRLKERRNRL